MGEAGRSATSFLLGAQAIGNELPEPEVRVRSHWARNDNRMVEFQIEPGGSPSCPTPCAALVEMGADCREPAQRPWTRRRCHAGDRTRELLHHALKLLGWRQFGSAATGVQRSQEGRHRSPPAGRCRLRTYLGHTFSHDEDRIVVVAEDVLDAKEGVEFALVDAIRTVRKPNCEPSQAPRAPVRLRQPERMLMFRRDAAVRRAASEPARWSSSPDFEVRGSLIADCSRHSYKLR